MILPLLLVLAQQQPLRGLDAYVAKAMADWRVPGMAIVVVKDDSVVFINGYGVRELGKPDPVQKYIPTAQFADPYVTREITVRDLLTHRVGFGDTDYLWGTSGLDFAA